MNTDRVSSLFWLLLGLVTIYGAFQLGLGTMHEPGSGFLAFLAGCFICCIAVGIFLQSIVRWRGTPLEFKSLWTGANWHRSFIIGLVTVGFILALEGLGFFVTSFLLLFCLFKWVEKLSWGKAVIIPALTLTVTYVVFNIFLKSNLPRGIFGF
jgi:putative tricarboxylic transport membrane protein